MPLGLFPMTRGDEPMAETALHKIEIPQGYLQYKVTDENIELTDLFVSPKNRRQGYGTKLIRKLERIATRRGKVCIYCFTRTSNKTAQAFYEAVGFEKVCSIPKFYRSEGAEMYIKKL